MWRRVVTSVLIAGLWTSLACGGDDAGAGDTQVVDAGEDAAEGDAGLMGRSIYEATFSTFDDKVFQVTERDITDRSDFFTFGSAHIAPAVSFAMTDSITYPATITFTLDFGVVVASSALDAAITGPGEYVFGPGQPSVHAFISPFQYRSTIAGASGTLTIEEWSTATGEPVRGRFEGTLLQDTDNADKKALEIDGWFYFTLPEKDDGQPG